MVANKEVAHSWARAHSFEHNRRFPIAVVVGARFLHHQAFPISSGNFAIFAAIRRASSLLSNLAAERLTGSRLPRAFPFITNE